MSLRYLHRTLLAGFLVCITLLASCGLPDTVPIISDAIVTPPAGGGPEGQWELSGQNTVSLLSDYGLAIYYKFYDPATGSARFSEDLIDWDRRINQAPQNVAQTLFFSLSVVDLNGIRDLIPSVQLSKSTSWTLTMTSQTLSTEDPLFIFDLAGDPGTLYRSGSDTLKKERFVATDLGIADQDILFSRLSEETKASIQAGNPDLQVGFIGVVVGFSIDYSFLQSRPFGLGLYHLSTP